MKARRIAILLTVAALSVVTLFVFTLFDETALGATDLGLGGINPVEILAVPVEGGSGDLLAPFANQEGPHFKFPPNPVIFPHRVGPKETE